MASTASSASSVESPSLDDESQRQSVILQSWLSEGHGVGPYVPGREELITASGVPQGEQFDGQDLEIDGSEESEGPEEFEESEESEESE